MTIQTHLNHKQTISLGSFYTPDFVVKIAYEMLLDHVPNIKNYTLLDNSCGYGSFLRLDGFKQNIGADIDENALAKARKNLEDFLPKPLFLNVNSLYNVTRKKFGITESDKLIIMGNPPYNDKTSIVQNNLKAKNTILIDSKLQTRDIGISFLRSFDELRADYICILHPLSYLIKGSNFKSLKNFAKYYRLLDSLIISSSLFCPKSLGYFPIVIALYQRNMQGMDFEFVSNFNFKTLENKVFRLNDFEFITKYIDKYPNQKRIKNSQKVAMFYTMRDINALRRSKTFIQKDCTNAIYITQEKYSLYCYVDVFKMMIVHIPYYLGNCDVIINFNRFKELETAFVQASETKILTSNIKDYFQELLGIHYEN